MIKELERVLHRLEEQAKTIERLEKCIDSLDLSSSPTNNAGVREGGESKK